jgi:hypothetical protein
MIATIKGAKTMSAKIMEISFLDKSGRTGPARLKPKIHAWDVPGNSAFHVMAGPGVSREMTIIRKNGEVKIYLPNR